VSIVASQPLDIQARDGFAAASGPLFVYAFFRFGLAFGFVGSSTSARRCSRARCE
jgi:hypothetical protein